MDICRLVTPMNTFVCFFFKSKPKTCPLQNIYLCFCKFWSLYNINKARSITYDKNNLVWGPGTWQNTWCYQSSQDLLNHQPQISPNGPLMLIPYCIFFLVLFLFVIKYDHAWCVLHCGSILLQMNITISILALRCGSILLAGANHFINGSKH